MSNASNVQAFLAYAGRSAAHTETMEQFVRLANDSGSVTVRSWRDIQRGGTLLMSEICGAIDLARLFVCDLTTLNHNVLFELGYAIGSDRRIWIVIDSSDKAAQTDYRSIRFLTQIAYVPYANSGDLLTSFERLRPFDDLDNTIFRQVVRSERDSDRSGKSVLYLKSPLRTDASIRLTQRIGSMKARVTIDDPAEVRMRQLGWYARHAARSHGVIAHFLSNAQIGADTHNAKAAFVCGLARALGADVLMLAHSPFVCPVDYEDLLEVHDTARNCVRIADPWLVKVDEAARLYRKRAAERREGERAEAQLRTLDVGDPMAENETQELADYFVPTGFYTTALESTYALLVGRKGSGKTAIFYQLADELESTGQAFVTSLKPAAYDMEGLAAIVREITDSSTRRFLVGSFWKLLIYSEIARSFHESTHKWAAYYSPSEGERLFLDYVEEHSKIILPDFTSRLESAVDSLGCVTPDLSPAESRALINEQLHEQAIEKLRAVLGECLDSKPRVQVLVDNLDTAWSPDADLETYAHVLLGLLSQARDIVRDLRRKDHWRKAINACFTVFLRSDIFWQLVPVAGERDKFGETRIVWHDPELLIRLLSERFNVALGELSADKEWRDFFIASVGSRSIDEYLLYHSLPRPRDLIYFVRCAISAAVNRGHKVVEFDDLEEGRLAYSQYALDALVAEGRAQYPQIEELLYEFAGLEDVLEEPAILSAAQRVRISGENVGGLCEVLFRLGFLAKEVENGRFEYLYDEADLGKWTAMARRYAETECSGVNAYRIHPAYHAYLEVVPVE